MKRPATLVKALQMQEHHHDCTSEPPDILLTNKLSHNPQQRILNQYAILINLS
jgi:hypothetical protein